MVKNGIVLAINCRDAHSAIQVLDDMSVWLKEMAYSQDSKDRYAWHEPAGILGFTDMKLDHHAQIPNRNFREGHQPLGMLYATTNHCPYSRIQEGRMANKDWQQYFICICIRYLYRVCPQMGPCKLQNSDTVIF